MAQFIDPFPGMKAGEKLDERELARAIRQAIAAEHEAVHLYEAIADATDDKRAKAVMQEIADEEKVHVGELQSLLESIQPDEKDHVDEGRDEVKDKLAAWLSKNLRLS